MSPAKHSYGSVTDERTDRQTDRQTDDGQSDPYVSLCFAGNTKNIFKFMAGAATRARDNNPFLTPASLLILGVGPY